MMEEHCSQLRNVHYVPLHRLEDIDCIRGCPVVECVSVLRLRRVGPEEERMSCWS